jgi:hypothetical protein
MKNNQIVLPVKPQLVLLLYLVSTCCAAPAIADTLPIISYSMENGDAGGQTYFDDTYGGPGATGNPNVAGSFLSGGLGQLTNNLFALPSDIFDDEWIGWGLIQPTITLDLGSPHLINSVSVHASNLSPLYNDVGAPGAANLWYSQDNMTFTPLGLYNTTEADRGGDDPRWVDLPFNVVARYARVQLFDGFKTSGTNPGQKPWVFLDEARVNGGAPPTGLSYPDFSNPTGLILSGNAAKVGNVIRLSTATPSNAGTVFTSSPVQLGTGDTFSTHFQFRITNSGGIPDEDGTGADGLVFVIQAGTTGGGIGYANPGLGIEFDTWNNGPAYGDPNGNHVGIDLNGSIVSVQTQTEPVRFNNGEIWNAWIDYNGTSDQLEVRWSLIGVRPASAQLSRIIDLPALLAQNIAYVGFTSAGAGGWGDHDLLSWVATSGFTSLSSLPGDYNNNGVVDGADYVSWRKNRNASAALTNDTTPSSVTNVDYAVWRSHFGQTAGSGSGNSARIPEPAALTLLLSALCFVATRTAK